MKNKYYEYIIIYLSVALVCAAIGLIVRATVVAKGVDAFSANTIFWLITGLGILIYCILTVLIQGLSDKMIIFFFSRRKNVKPEQLEASKPLSLEDIRSEKQEELNQQKAERLGIAIQYSRKTLAPYISDADMKLLYEYIEMYSEGTSFEKITIQPVKIKELTTTDVCHFGWNIWNHFNVADQWGAAQFLKTVFHEKLKDVELKTIKKKLKIFEPNSTIKIQEILQTIE
ncbi:MAG: mobilization protein [Prevotella sp.]|jgi:ribosomal protein L13E|nr:mobilization protein [Prevotella sp.]